jgi:hypothetical protein
MNIEIGISLIDLTYDVQGINPMKSLSNYVNELQKELEVVFPKDTVKVYEESVAMFDINNIDGYPSHFGYPHGFDVVADTIEMVKDAIQYKGDFWEVL